ncbi:hypothetical protein EOA85_30985 [Mesorhizobium sp. M5C.F.Ca.IN.020.29.1.1]|uniref:hypothetical protein n=1 Tax=unclassified Mesorhizobium TaxID=325217 RepID=UPI000FCAB5AF|nr:MULTISPECIES: hypothetical protein [unclassified Mesorhizobium]RUV50415.1 hypothetical protein EOA85_30985 [Mesorhizobium sp. M5C.F.Ca.IN.020.29.1.1]TIM81531.1 MAG: hypothetical protein E5Y50_32995 [Mesorhizobium sp.]
MHVGPPLRFTIQAVDEQRQLSMPIATSEDEAEMRAQFKEICKKMPHMHVELYDGATLIDERQPNVSFH